jgi:hypothetical protein
MSDPNPSNAAVHVPGLSTAGPYLVARFLRADEVFLTLLVPSTAVLQPGTCLLEGPASCRIYRIIRVEGTYPLEAPEGWIKVLVCAKPDHGEGHEFRLQPPNPESAG